MYRCTEAHLRIQATCSSTLKVMKATAKRTRDVWGYNVGAFRLQTPQMTLHCSLTSLLTSGFRTARA
jgi:hypothetical protein